MTRRDTGKRRAGVLPTNGFDRHVLFYITRIAYYPITASSCKRFVSGTKGLICTRCLAGCNGVHKNEKLNDVGKSKPHSDTATTKRDGDCMPMAMRNVGPPFIKKKNRVYSVY